jgi:hypothetical protein
MPEYETGHSSLVSEHFAFYEVGVVLADDDRVPASRQKKCDQPGGVHVGMQYVRSLPATTQPPQQSRGGEHERDPAYSGRRAGSRMNSHNV